MNILVTAFVVVFTLGIVLSVVAIVVTFIRFAMNW